jgi:hypothetical protein
MDTTGLIPSYSETVDSNGNYEVEALTAISYKWTTPLAAWEILNLSTDISSTTTMNLSSITGMTLDSKLTVDISATASITLDSALIKLGGSAVSPVIKGTELVAAFSTFNGVVLPLAILAATAAKPLPDDIVKLAAAWNALALQLPILVSNLTSALSKKVMVE